MTATIGRVRMAGIHASSRARDVVHSPTASHIIAGPCCRSACEATDQAPVASANTNAPTMASPELPSLRRARNSSSDAIAVLPAAIRTLGSIGGTPYVNEAPRCRRQCQGSTPNHQSCTGCRKECCARWEQADRAVFSFHDPSQLEKASGSISCE